MRKVYTFGAAVLVLLLVVPFGNAKNRLNTRKVVRPSCITCGWQGNCRSCVGGGNKQYCRTPDCSTCDESGACEGGDGGGLQPESSQTKQTDRVGTGNSSKTFRLSPKLIKEVGISHPRFGATLANLNMFGFSVGDHTIHWTPVEITSSDMEAFLDRKSHERFFRKYNQRACATNTLIQKSEVEEIVYMVTITRQDANTWTIKLQVQGSPVVTLSDPGYSTLLVTAIFDGANLESEKPTKATWKIN